jgi:hypothetical protein
MANVSEIKLVISSDGSAAIQEIRRIQQESKNMEGTTGTVASQLKAHWFAISAAIGTAMIGISQAMDMAKLGAKALQSELAFENVARSMNINASKWIEDLKRVTNNTIDDSDLMRQAMKGVSGGLSGDQMVRIAEIARTSARRMGVDVGEAYGRIADAVEIARTKQLLAFGLITKGQMEVMDKAKAAGMAVDAFTVISLNAAIQQEKMGKSTENAAEQFQKHAAAMQQMREEIGKVLLEIKTFVESSVIMRWWQFWVAIGEVISTGTEGAKRRGQIAVMSEAYMPGPYSGVKEEAGTAKKDPKKELDDLMAKYKAAGASGDMASINKAQADWEKTVAMLNPALSEEAKKIGELEAKAKALTITFSEPKYAGKDKTWIAAGLAQAKEYLEAIQAIADDEFIRSLGEVASYFGEIGEYTSEFNPRKLEYEKEIQKYYESEAELSKKIGEMLEIELKAKRELFELAQKELEVKREILNIASQTIMSNANLIGGEGGKWSGIAGGAVTNQAQAYVMKKMGIPSKEEQTIYDAYKTKTDLMVEAGASEEDMIKARDEMFAQLERDGFNKRLDQYRDYTNGVIGLMGMAAATMGADEETMFRIQQAYAIANAIVNTAQGVTKALSMGPWGIPLAVAIGAMGAAQIAMITAAQPGGSATGTGVMPVGTASYSQPTTDKWETTRTSPSVTIHIYGNVVDQDEFARQLVPAISKAWKDGAH